MERPGYRMSREALRRAALAALAGVGDETLGQWEEWSGALTNTAGRNCYHVKRRLSAEEATRIAAPADIRGTPEERRRLAALPAITRRALGLA